MVQHEFGCRGPLRAADARVQLTSFFDQAAPCLHAEQAAPLANATHRCVWVLPGVPMQGWAAGAFTAQCRCFASPSGLVAAALFACPVVSCGWLSLLSFVRERERDVGRCMMLRAELSDHVAGCTNPEHPASGQHPAPILPEPARRRHSAWFANPHSALHTASPSRHPATGAAEGPGCGPGLGNASVVLFASAAGAQVRVALPVVTVCALLGATARGQLAYVLCRHELMHGLNRGVW